MIGAAVRKLRLSQRVTVSQNDLAGRLSAQGVNMDRTAIARIEHGERYVLDYEALALARAFKVPIENLYAGM